MARLDAWLGFLQYALVLSLLSNALLGGLLWAILTKRLRSLLCGVCQRGTNSP
jgi:hypothetical protein